MLGLLLVGSVAAEDGLFDAAGTWLARTGLGTRALYLALLTLVALVTAILNLDTAVWFLTPVLVLAARGRAVPERPFLYGAVFMANAGSLILPGSNLTNLIVLAHEHVAGTRFFVRMLPASLAAASTTALLLAALHRHELRGDGRRSGGPIRWRLGLGLAATATATALVLVVPQPALPVLAVGVGAVALRGVPLGRIREEVEPLALLGLFLLAVVLGTFARTWDGPSELLESAGFVATAGLGAGLALAVNNLPAAVLLSAHVPSHPRALLVGLNLGPNLFVTGSLSAFLWLRAARGVGARPSLGRFTLLGAVIVPVSMAAALLALRLLAPGGL